MPGIFLYWTNPPDVVGAVTPVASEVISLFLVRILHMACLLSEEMDTVTGVQTLDEADCISQGTNTLGNGINPIIFTPTMGK